VEDMPVIGSPLCPFTVFSISAMNLGDACVSGVKGVGGRIGLFNMILRFLFIALNSKTDWTLQNLPTEIVNKNMERFNLHLPPPRL